MATPSLKGKWVPRLDIMNSLIKVSIIVCAYNGQTFLPKCLDSIFNQSLLEIEIILVNDGSTDQTLSIMESYRAKYIDKYGNRITIVDQPNSGTSVSRKNGVLAAKGEYIGFVDCDDHITLDRFEKMYNCACKYDVDIVQSRTRGNAVEYEAFLSNSSALQNAEDVLKLYLMNSRRLRPALWQQIQKKSLYNKHTFPNWHEIHEDEFAYPMLLANAKNVYFLNEQLYFYNTTNTKGTMGQVYSSKNGRYNQGVALLRSCMRLEKYLKKKNRFQAFKKEFIFYKGLRLLHFVCLLFITDNVRLSKIKEPFECPQR